MALIQSQDIVDNFGISAKAKIDATRFDRYVTTALAKLKTWVDQDVWDNANSSSPNTSNVDILQAAAINLTMYFALPSLHTYLTENGILQAAQSEGNTTLKYLTPKEVQQMQTTYWNLAEEAVSIIQPVSDTEGDGSSIVSVPVPSESVEIKYTF